MSEKRYLKNNKELMKEWNWDKNSELSLDNITIGMNKKVWWKCSKCNYEWTTTIYNRYNGRGCPECAKISRSNTRRIAKIGNGMLDVRPELILDWNFEKNKNIQPEMLNSGSDRKVWWKCHVCYYEWQTSIGNRARLKRNCPNCAKINKKKDVINAKIALHGSLLDNYPDLLKEWSYDKNRIKPSEYLSNSGQKVWWECSKCGYEWQAKIAHRVKGVGCPICGKELAVINRTEALLKNNASLAESNSNLMKEWNYDKNLNVNPNRILPMSNEKVWWVCKKGHEWQAVVHSRVKGSGCPICKKELHTSFPEKSIYYYIVKYFKDAIENYKIKKFNNLEFDIFIPSLNIAIEYDGKRWHKNIKKDINKNKISEELKINLIRVREKGLPKDFNEYNYVSNIELQNDSKIELNNTIIKILERLGIFDCNVDVDRDIIDIYELLEMSEKKDSLAELFPNLLNEWNYNKNGKIKPEYLKSKSNKKVWWECSKCGYEWQSAIYSRTNGNGCPVCSGQKIVQGYNDLFTTNFELCKEWNYEKNIIKPTETSKGSNKKVWWTCCNNHEWEATISSRVRGNGCPVCSGQKIVQGYNDLLTTNFELCKEWNYEKNIIKPTEISKGSNKKVWWICCNNHEWEATISSRVNGNGCPVCSNRKVQEGYNDLLTKYPKLCEEWNYEKNIIKPTDVSYGSQKYVWWKCKEGHEWRTTIHNRTKGTGCPICYKKKK